MLAMRPHRLAADHEALRRADLRDNVAPRLHQHRLAIGRASLAAATSRRHVGKLEARDANLLARDALGDRVHEGMVHRRAGPMGKHHRDPRVGGAVHHHLDVMRGGRLDTHRV
jgi:hypothetical protein